MDDDNVLTIEKLRRTIYMLNEVCQPSPTLRIIENPHLLEDGPPVVVRLTWKERLLSKPWRPWIATRTDIPKVPSRKVYRLADGTTIMHPALAAELRKQLRAKPDTPL